MFWVLVLGLDFWVKLLGLGFLGSGLGF